MPYLSAYPRAGLIALLCEGDLIGYEATLFQKWTGAELGTAPLVDIWPCGTKNSIFGISDAIGRSRPIFVIEDRDFRSIDESRDDSARNKSDRERRDIRVLAWSAWIRCEIENYLLEPDVLLPVFREAFGCTDDDIVLAVNEILPPLALCQAAQHVRSRAQRLWMATDPVGALLSGLTSSPTWNDNERAIVPPDEQAFRIGLHQKSRSWIEQMHAVQCDVVQDFDSQLALWRNCQWHDVEWRTNWAGKEILHWLRIALTSRFGWPIDGDPERRQPLNWTLNRARREAQDRLIESALRPRMIDQFLAKLPSLPMEIRDEFDGMKNAIKSQEV
jgi:hypothetical protein